jgi:protoporphyrinogen oxidase
MAHEKPIVIMGAGPAGLTAAWYLTLAEQKVVVWEADAKYVGGLARTIESKGCRIDIGGHRFFSKSAEVNDVWRKIMPDSFQKCYRLSRIFMNGTYFSYPPSLLDMLLKVGPFQIFLIICSYLKASRKPIKPERTMQDWAINHFGKRLYNLFFKNYTEKVWGMPANRLSKEWAPQRLQGIDLKGAVTRTLFGWTKNEARALEKMFYYPKLGPGQMWERAAFTVRAKGNQVVLDRKVQNIHWEQGYVTHITAIDSSGRLHQQEGSHFFSSLPLPDLLKAMDPQPPQAVLEAVEKLRFRDFLTVCLVVNRRDVFPDQWIYVHDKEVRVARIQNYKNWSIDMVPNPKITTLGMEYFCFENDALWSASDYELRRIATKEAVALRLVKEAEVTDAIVVRMPKAYPIYDEQYRQNLFMVSTFLMTVPNLQPIGRNGMHRYNNQDHSMMTALLSSKNILGEGAYDIWSVNNDAEYIESNDPPARK